MANARPRYIGVKSNRRKFMVDIVNPLIGTDIWLGTFPTAEIAARQFDAVNRLFYGDNAGCNFPSPDVNPNHCGLVAIGNPPKLTLDPTKIFTPPPVVNLNPTAIPLAETHVVNRAEAEENEKTITGIIKQVVITVAKEQTTPHLAYQIIRALSSNPGVNTDLYIKAISGKVSIDDYIKNVQSFLSTLKLNKKEVDDSLEKARGAIAKAKQNFNENFEYMVGVFAEADGICTYLKSAVDGEDVNVLAELIFQQL